MKIGLGNDHAGFDIKDDIITLLENLGHEVIDFGTNSNTSCDYPIFASVVSKAVKKGEVERGILICGSGIGMSIAANKYPGIRAALCTMPEMAKLSRMHNDANVLCIGSRLCSIELLKEIVTVWLQTEFEGDRHVQRIQKIADIESGRL